MSDLGRVRTGAVEQIVFRQVNERIGLRCACLISGVVRWELSFTFAGATKSYNLNVCDACKNKMLEIYGRNSNAEIREQMVHRSAPCMHGTHRWESGDGPCFRFSTWFFEIGGVGKTMCDEHRDAIQAAAAKAILNDLRWQQIGELA
jgi:hypothetical protein